MTRHNPHKVGEILRGGGSYNPKDTYFSENWSVQQIDDAVQISCNTAVKSGFTDGQFSMTCYGEKVNNETEYIYTMDISDFITEIKFVYAKYIEDVREINEDILNTQFIARTNDLYRDFLDTISHAGLA